jgi:hypothetical protein
MDLGSFSDSVWASVSPGLWPAVVAAIVSLMALPIAAEAIQIQIARNAEHRLGQQRPGV